MLHAFIIVKRSCFINNMVEHIIFKQAKDSFLVVEDELKSCFAHIDMEENNLSVEDIRKIMSEFSSEDYGVVIKSDTDNFPFGNYYRKHLFVFPHKFSYDVMSVKEFWSNISY